VSPDPNAVGAVGTGWCLGGRRIIKKKSTVGTGWGFGVSTNLLLNCSADMKLGRTEIKEYGHASCSLQ
jgi:hypothetical protein